eukprot:GHVN01041515.1.p4 GENE.GHVN01041515.1~~GHVN01041515.1.p4  ORF type:complete len:107 (+),score=13.48 GHVN01041515.1:1246-1566(+)
MKDAEEVEDDYQGAAGVIADQGGASFRRFSVGPFDWPPRNLGSAQGLANSNNVEGGPTPNPLVGLPGDLGEKYCPNNALCSARFYEAHKLRSVYNGKLVGMKRHHH